MLERAQEATDHLVVYDDGAPLHFGWVRGEDESDIQAAWIVRAHAATTFAEGVFCRRRLPLTIVEGKDEIFSYGMELCDTIDRLDENVYRKSVSINEK